MYRIFLLDKTHHSNLPMDFFCAFTPNAPIGALKALLRLCCGYSVVYQVSKKYTREVATSPTTRIESIMEYAQDGDHFI